MDKSYYLLIIIGILALALIVAVAAYLVLPIQPPYIPRNTLLDEAPTVSITLYAGELSNSNYGFGTEPNNLTSPGPTLRFKTTDVINLTIVNIGMMPHAFQMTNSPRTGASVVFDVAIASTNNPLRLGQSASVIFNPNIPGNYYYICPVPGHVEVGMWGTIIVE